MFFSDESTVNIIKENERLRVLESQNEQKFNQIFETN